MPRPLRPQIAGGIYHVTSRGNRRCEIYRDDHDRTLFLSLLLGTVDEYEWECHAWCLMSTHFHLLVTTVAPTIAGGMQRLKSRYAESFNARYRLVGHLFGGRYAHRLVKGEAHLLEAHRYIALNPVRAGACERPEEWDWSSYAGLIRGYDGRLYEPSILLKHFEGPDARRRLARFVEAGRLSDAARRGHVRGLTPDMARVA
jgi:REP element-mobilizing transposase RayT